MINSGYFIVLSLILAGPSFARLRAPVPAETNHTSTTSSDNSNGNGSGSDSASEQTPVSSSRGTAGAGDAEVAANRARQTLVDESTAFAMAIIDNPNEKSFDKLGYNKEVEAALKNGKLSDLADLVGGNEAAEKLSNIYAFRTDFGKFFDQNITAIKEGKIPKGVDKLMTANAKNHGLAAKEISARTGEKPEVAALRLQKIQNLVKQNDMKGAGEAMSSLMSTLRDRQQLAATLNEKVKDYSLSGYFEKAAAKEKGLFGNSVRGKLATQDDPFTQAFGEHWQTKSLPRMKAFNEWMKSGNISDPEKQTEFGNPESWGNWAVSSRNTTAIMALATPPKTKDQPYTISSKYFASNGNETKVAFRDARELTDFFKHADTALAKQEGGKGSVEYAAFFKQEIERVANHEANEQKAAFFSEAKRGNLGNALGAVKKWKTSQASIKSVGISQILSKSPGEDTYTATRQAEQKAATEREAAKMASRPQQPPPPSQPMTACQLNGNCGTVTPFVIPDYQGQSTCTPDMPCYRGSR